MLSLFLDEDAMDRGLVRGLRTAGLDVVTVEEAGRRSASDEEQLEYAASVSRTLYTCNVRDFTRLNASWMNSGRHHAGIIVLVEQSTYIGIQIRALVRLAAARDLTAMRDHVEFLGNWTDA